jgi:hypothetical protein
MSIKKSELSNIVFNRWVVSASRHIREEVKQSLTVLIPTPPSTPSKSSKVPPKSNIDNKKHQMMYILNPEILYLMGYLITKSQFYYHSHCLRNLVTLNQKNNLKKSLFEIGDDP